MSSFSENRLTNHLFVSLPKLLLILKKVEGQLGADVTSLLIRKLTNDYDQVCSKSYYFGGKHNVQQIPTNCVTKFNTNCVTKFNTNCVTKFNTNCVTKFNKLHNLLKPWENPTRNLHFSVFLLQQMAEIPKFFLESIFFSLTKWIHKLHHTTQHSFSNSLGLMIAWAGPNPNIPLASFSFMHPIFGFQILECSKW